MLRIALDAMGGDHAPHSAVHGGIEAARHGHGRFEVVLVGEQNAIQKEIDRHFRTHELPVSIVHAPDWIRMDEQPSMGLKKKESSIAVAMGLHREGKVDAVVSAGNTGAVMASALFTLQRVKGVRRPAIGMLLPTQTGQTLIIDAGANVDSRPSDLFEFGLMGSIFYSRLFSESTPRVGLLSVGHEDVKGNDTTLRAHQLLSHSNLRFVGNVEGGDILTGKADIVVCDGFVGNIVLKFAESFHGLFKTNFRRLLRKYLFSQVGVLLMKPTLEGIRRVFDYQEYGGAPLLGVKGVTMIAHGRSTPRAIKNAIVVAHKMALENVHQHIQDRIAELKNIERETFKSTRSMAHV